MRPRRVHAFTLVELIVVIGLVLVLALFLLPMIAGHNHSSPRIKCVMNLKNVGLSFRIWATDNSDDFPMGARTNSSGVADWVSKPDAVVRAFQLLSNELSQPKILVCPVDTRKPAKDFTVLKNENISYFVGLVPNGDRFHMILGGDHNITNGVAPKNGMLDLVPTRPTGWTHTIHRSQGNVVLADGSVQQLSQARLSEQLADTGDTTNRILLPE